MVQVGNGIRTSSTSPWYHYSTSMGKLNNRKEVKNEDQLRARIIWKVETGADPGFILVRVTQNVCVIWFIFVKTHHFTIIKHGFFDWHVQPSRKIRGVGCASDAHAAPGCEATKPSPRLVLGDCSLQSGHERDEGGALWKDNPLHSMWSRATEDYA